MNFQEAETHFRNLENAYRNGQLDQAKYNTSLARIQVIDAKGTVWQMQAHTGAWHYFYNGQWVPASPYPATTAQVIPQAPYSPPPQPATKAKAPIRRPFALLWIIGAFVMLGLCVGMIGVGYYLYSNNLAGTPKTAESVQPPSAPQAAKTTFQKMGVTTAKGDGSPVVDAHGVALTVPPGSLSEGLAGQMTALKIQGQLSQVLENSYTLDTPFYAITTQGQNDAIGRSTLIFPAANPQSRIVEVIDQEYIALLNVHPENDKLTIRAPMSPAEPKDLTKDGKIGPGGSVYYAVITPKSGGTSDVPSGVKMVNWVQPQTTSGVDCTPAQIRRYSLSKLCRTNAAGTVIVLYPSDLGLTANEGDLVVQEVETRMKTYADLGFTAAKLNPDAPLEVIVTPAGGDPYYQVSNEIIYLPLDIAKDMPGKGKSLWHEMGHWIQDVSYNMTWAFWNGNKRWWMEVAAENMVMLADPGYITDNMDTYGTITDSSNSLAFADSPYQWPADFYVHSQLVKVNMCDSGCPLSRSSFIEAINKGTYPYDDSGIQEKLTANLDDYARYLLGAAPIKANTAISLTAVQSQRAYGQTVNISKSTKGNFAITHNGNPPQLVKETKNGTDSLVFQVALQKDGVYPLEITSGSQGKYSGMPAMLTIAAGTPLYYRLDNGEVQYDDGTKELILGPIHTTFGIGTLRLVAFSKTGSQTFSAHLDVIDLKGAWVIQNAGVVNNGVTCSTSGTDNGTTDTANFIAIFPLLSNIMTATGDMTPDTSGPSLDWSLVPARLPAGFKSDQFSFKGTALIGTDGVELQSEVDLPEQKSTSQNLPPVAAGPGLAIVACLPAAALSRRAAGKKGRYLALALTLLLAGLFLTGCFGLGIYGATGADVKITGMQYVGGDQKASWTVGLNGQLPAEKPIWAITQGTATYQVHGVLEVKSSDDHGKDTTGTTTCTGPITYKITGGIYPDLTIAVQSQ
jgi:hypothetical protein